MVRVNQQKISFSMPSKKIQLTGSQPRVFLKSLYTHCEHPEFSTLYLLGPILTAFSHFILKLAKQTLKTTQNFSHYAIYHHQWWFPHFTRYFQVLDLPFMLFNWRRLLSLNQRSFLVEINPFSNFTQLFVKFSLARDSGIFSTTRIRTPLQGMTKASKNFLAPRLWNPKDR